MGHLVESPVILSLKLGLNSHARVPSSLIRTHTLKTPRRCLWPPISTDRIAPDGFVVRSRDTAVASGGAGRAATVTQIMELRPRPSAIALLVGLAQDRAPSLVTATRLGLQ